MTLISIRIAWYLRAGSRQPCETFSFVVNTSTVLTILTVNYVVLNGVRFEVYF